MHTFAAEKPSTPSSSAVFSYPIGASSLYGPVFEVSLTVDVSTVRLGSVVVSVADGAMRMDFGGMYVLWDTFTLVPTLVYMFFKRPLVPGLAQVSIHL
jgi:hypothetical protein